MRYRRNYYITHSEICRTRARNYALNNPDKVKTYLDRFKKTHPTYRRDMTRIRVAAVEPLIFQFLDGGFDKDINDFIDYLRSHGTPEQHLKWFRVDVQPFLEDVQSNPSPQCQELYTI